LVIRAGPAGLGRLLSVETMLRIALWSILLAAITYTTADPDLWGHVRFGLDILRDRTIPHLDPYSFSSDQSWINHEWAAEALAAGAFRIGGNTGLILVKVALVAAMLFLLDATLRREGVDASRARDVLAAIAMITTLEQAFHVRPQVFSLAFFAALLACLTAARRTRQWLVLLPPLFAVWANLHGGWMVGGGVLALWTAGVAVSGRAKDAAWLAAAGAASLCATLINPYGFGLWHFLRDTIGFGRADIAEWQPVYALGWNASVRWCAALALGLFGVRAGGAERHPERLAVVVALGVASLMVTRLLGFFALAVLFLFGPALGDAYRRHYARRPVGQRPAPRRVLAAVALTIAGAAAFVVAMNLGRLRVDPRFTPERDAVAFLKNQPNARRVLVWFDWGEYAIWHLSPGARVSIDGRRETVYSADLQERHLRFYFDAPGGAALPRELGADYIWIPRALPAARRLEADSGWQRVYEGAQSVVFARTGLKAASVPILVSAAIPRTFPGP